MSFIKSVVLHLALVLVALNSFSQEARTFPNDPIKVKQYVLKNGLTVILSENHDVPQVYGMVVVKAGGKNDPADATGLAHYLEHMLFKGTTTMGTVNYELEKPYLDSINDLYEQLGKTEIDEERKVIQKEINRQSILAGKYAVANELDKMLSEIGSTGVNAFTTEEITTYHNTFPSNQIEKWLEIYSHRFREPVFRLFQSELETVYEEKNRSNDNAFSQVFEQFSKNFYKKHPYGQQSVLGTTEHLKNPPLKKMYDYFNTYYVANNMALILAGDFKAEEVMPMIEAKFGNWRTGELPEFPKFKEEPFNGREEVVVKLTPVKVGAMGFRTVPNGHKDMAALEVCNNILSNEEQSGLIDKLTVDGEVTMAGVFSLVYNDYGGTLLFVVPKIVGQSVEKAEALVKAKIKLVHNGEFDNEMMDAVKLNLRKKIAMKWESNEERVLEIAFCFGANRSWGDYVKMEEEIAAVTKEDVVRVAKTYFGDDYLMFISKMGFPKKEKLDKPGFEPVIPKNEIKSEFYTVLSQLPTAKTTPRYVNFKEEIQTTSVQPGVTLNANKNPFNTVFSATIKYGIGTYHLPELKYAAEYMNLTGTEKLSVTELKRKLYEIGCSYYFSANEKELVLSIDGVEEKLPEALAILNDFIHHPKADDKKVKKILDDKKSEDKVQRREPSYIAGALQQYVLYGKNSSYLRDLGNSELKKLTGAGLVSMFKQALDYEVTINYTGKKSSDELKEIFVSGFKFKEQLKPKTPTVVIDRVIPVENIIYVVNKKDAVQSQIFFNIEGQPLDLYKAAEIDAFNEYFGGNMSSIVFQEIREFRSLAYSANAYYRSAPLTGKNNFFSGYIGCQGDKTMDAMEAMLELINNMPQKTERTDMIKSALIQTAQSDRPNFRGLINTSQRWQEQGYKDDPNKVKSDAYAGLNFDSILSLYNREIKNKKMSITIVGDTKKFDLKKLENYGKVVMVKEKALFNN